MVALITFVKRVSSFQLIRHQQCHQQHVVFLANSAGLKVGITRTKNQSWRWIDQGALRALPIIQTGNRYQCGLV